MCVLEIKVFDDVPVVPKRPFREEFRNQSSVVECGWTSPCFLSLSLPPFLR